MYKIENWDLKEDAHVAALGIDGMGTSLFGVFDGHGGKEVALFVAKYIVMSLYHFK